MGDAREWEEIRAMPLRLDRRTFVSDVQLAEAHALPGYVEIRDRTVSLEYDVEDSDAGPLGVVRLRVPEKLARTLVEEEIPELDRPIRYVVPRGQRGSVRGATVFELQQKLDLPFTEDEQVHPQQTSREEQDGRKRERNVREARGEFQRHGKRGGPGGRHSGPGGRGQGGRKKRR